MLRWLIVVAASASVLGPQTTRPVDIDVVVRDDHGRIVTGLRDDVTHYYLLTYVPTARAGKRGPLHRLKVTVPHRQLHVRSRTVRADD